jgi:hypothetical protein
MRSYLLSGLTVLLVAACGGGSQTGGTPAADGTPAATPAGCASTSGSPQSAASGAAASAPSAGNAGLGGRTTELLNPDTNTMVFLYYDLVGLTPPIDSWVEKDNRVQFAQPIDKPAMRQTVRAEFESGIASVRGVGLIRLPLNSANLSDYDPTYGEFTIRALSPSSEVTFKALDQEVKIRFANGRTAQIWKVPPDQAQAIRDRVGFIGGGGANNVDLELLLRIKSVLPGPGGGTILTDVLEYEMRETRSGATLSRVQLAQ